MAISRYILLLLALICGGDLFAEPPAPTEPPNPAASDSPAKRVSRPKKPIKWVIGVAPDIHGNRGYAALAFEQMKEQGVNRLWYPGDITHSGRRDLTEILQLGWRVTKVRPKLTDGVPGNREIRNGMSYQDAISAMEPFMNVLAYTDNSYGFRQLENETIAGSHFLLFKPHPSIFNEIFGPPPIFGHGFSVGARNLALRALFGRKWHLSNFRFWEMHLANPTTRNQMRVDYRLPKGRATLLITGHTHEQYYFYDPESDLWVLNFGTLALPRGNVPGDRNTFADQGAGFGIIRFTEGQKDMEIEWRDALQPGKILHMLRPYEERRSPDFNPDRPPCMKILKSMTAEVRTISHSASTPGAQ